MILIRILPLFAAMLLMASCSKEDWPEEWRSPGRDAYATCDYKRAFAYFYDRADAGIAEDQINVAVMYARGRYVEQDRETALMWAYLAKERNNSLSDGVITSIGAEIAESERNAVLSRAVERAAAWRPRSERENTKTMVPEGKYDSYGRNADCHLGSRRRARAWNMSSRADRLGQVPVTVRA